MEDTTIILQGLVSPKQLELWKKNYKNCNVIISCWDDEQFDFNQGLVSSWLPKKWKVIKNQYPIVRFKSDANLDYQIITTLNALNHVKTKYVIKSRLDEYYSNVDLLLSKLKKDENKIVCGSVFFREHGLYPFHIADKLMCATKDNLILMFESTIHNIEIDFWKYTVPESQLGLGYVMGKEFNVDFDKWKVALSLTGNGNVSKDSVIKVIRATSDRLIKNSSDMLSNELFSKEIDWYSILDNIDHSNEVLQFCRNQIIKIMSEKIDDAKYIRKYFDVVDVNKLKPYIVTRSNGGRDGGRKWWHNNFNNADEECVTSLKNYGKLKK